MQNATKDLFAIIKFLRCSPFDEVKVWSQWVEQKGARGEERMNTLVRSLLLRRTKQQHLVLLHASSSFLFICNKFYVEENYFIRRSRSYNRRVLNIASSL